MDCVLSHIKEEPSQISYEIESSVSSKTLIQEINEINSSETHSPIIVVKLDDSINHTIYQNSETYSILVKSKAFLYNCIAYAKDQNISFKQKQLENSDYSKLIIKSSNASLIVDIPANCVYKNSYLVKSKECYCIDFSKTPTIND